MKAEAKMMWFANGKLIANRGKSNACLDEVDDSAAGGCGYHRTRISLCRVAADWFLRDQLHGADHSGVAPERESR
jgi:hypothetical protein